MSNGKVEDFHFDGVDDHISIPPPESVTAKEAFKQCQDSVVAYMNNDEYRIIIPSCLCTGYGMNYCRGEDKVWVEGHARILDMWQHVHYVRDIDGTETRYLNGILVDAEGDEAELFPAEELHQSGHQPIDKSPVIVVAVLMLLIGMLAGATIMKSELSVKPVSKVIYTGDCV